MFIKIWNLECRFVVMINNYCYGYLLNVLNYIYFFFSLPLLLLLILDSWSESNSGIHSGISSSSLVASFKSAVFCIQSADREVPCIILIGTIIRLVDVSDGEHGPDGFAPSRQDSNPFGDEWKQLLRRLVKNKSNR